MPPGRHAKAGARFAEVMHMLLESFSRCWQEWNLCGRWWASSPVLGSSVRFGITLQIGWTYLTSVVSVTTALEQPMQESRKCHGQGDKARCRWRAPGASTGGSESGSAATNATRRLVR